jgi:NitT/TauT family transport system permease protein
MIDIKAVFRPGKLPKKTMTIVIGIQVTMLIVLWFIVPSALIPTPIDVLNAFPSLWGDGMGQELGVSFALCLQGLFWSVLLSAFFAYGSVVPAILPTTTLLSKGRFLSMTGFIFVFTLMASGGHSLKIYMLTYGMTVFLVTALQSMVASVPQEDYDYARTLRMGEWQIVWEMIIRARLHEAIEIVCQVFAIGFSMLTMVEGIARAEGGIGVMLLNQNKHFMLAEIFAIQISIMLMGLLVDAGIRFINKLLCPYAFINQGR